MFTVEMFQSPNVASHCSGNILSTEQLQERLDSSHSYNRTITMIDQVCLGRRIPRIWFFTDNHIFGYPILPKDFVPCSMSFPFSITPREGFEDGCISTAEQYKRFQELLGSPGDSKTEQVETVEELVEYLNKYYS